MSVVIARYRRRYLSAMEDSPADQLLWPCIKHFLYADRSHGTQVRMLTYK